MPRSTRDFFILLGLATAVAAQEPAELVTDRPDQTESAIVVPQGTFQAELGASYEREDEGGERIEATQAPGTLLRYGLVPRLELRLAWAVFSPPTRRNDI